MAGAALAALTAPTEAAASVLYVGGSGCSDAGTGTAQQPYCTIGKAASVATAGQTVQVASGTYAEQVRPKNSGQSGLPIVYSAAPGASVTVTGGAHGFDLSYRSYISVAGFVVSDTTSSGIYLKVSDHIEVRDCAVTRAGQPTQGNTAYGIYLSATTNSLVRHNRTYANSAAGIYLTNGATNNQVDDNESYGNAEGYVRAATGIDIRAPGNLVTRNRVHDNEDSGIQAYPGGDNSVIAENISYHNKGFTTTAESNCDHPTAGNTAGCITGDHGIDNYQVTGNQVTGNTIYDNVSAGINVEGIGATWLAAAVGTTDSTITVGSTSGFPPTGNYDIRVDQETMTVVGGQGTTTWSVLRGQGGTSAASHSAGSSTTKNVLQPSHGIALRNNVSVDNAVNCPNGTGAGSCNRTKGEIRVDQYSWVGTTTDYDLVWTTNAYPYVYTWKNAMYKTLTEVQSSGQEMHGRQADPAWVSRSTGDFRLGSASPAIDVADSGATGEQTTDADGAPRVDDPDVANAGIGPRAFDDLGAYEWQNSTDSAPSAAVSVSPPSGVAPLNVTADASVSTDHDTTPISTYSFDFGDGTTVGPQASATASHVYTSAGTFTVTVTVADTAGLSGTATANVTVATAGTNLVSNSGFETGTSGWNTSGRAGVTITQVLGGHTGSYAAELDNTNATTSPDCTLNDSPDSVPTTQTGTYNASLWVSAPTAGATLTLRIREFSGGTFVGSQSAVVALSTGWQQVTASYVAKNPGHSNLDFNAYTTNAPTGTCFLADDASVTVS